MIFYSLPVGIFVCVLLMSDDMSIRSVWIFISFTSATRATEIVMLKEYGSG